MVERNQLQAQLQQMTLQLQRQQQAISTAHGLLRMIGLHPSQSMRWCSEAAQVLEPEVADHPPPFGIGLEKLSCPPFYTLIFEKIYVFISAFKFSKLQQGFKVSNSGLQT